jgi:nucleoside-diphosphate-sugar epimerase
MPLSVSDNDCLIGYSGFVGSTLLKQKGFKALYRSANIGDIGGRTFDTVVCAGAPAQKWMANRDPEADWENISGLMGHLETIRCRLFVLISTVDVFKEPVGVDEGTPVDRSGLHPYGLHRLRLEEFAARHFPRSLIVRLPGLVGPGLRKNVLFDFLNDNNLQTVDSRGIYQFYPMVNLWHDIRTALEAGLELIHLTAEPVSVAEVAARGFGMSFERAIGQSPAVYDMRTRHGKNFGAEGHYQYSRRETIQAIRAYAQSEPRTLKAPEETGK